MDNKKVTDEGKRIFVKCYMSEDNNNWVEKQAKGFGISKSAMVNICIANYKQNCEMAKTMAGFGDMLDRMEKLKEGEK